jgi:hypothetical protein
MIAASPSRSKKSRTMSTSNKVVNAHYAQRAMERDLVEAATSHGIMSGALAAAIR